MRKWIDFYRILQVHNSAEPEIIESAYKRLCRKYHPDINRSYDSDEKIISLNNAYEVLSNVDKRRQYHISWVKNNHKYQNQSMQDSKDTMPEREAIIVLENYFHYLSQSEFEKAFDTLSDYDKCTITKEAFARWQNAVSKTFKLLKYECTALKFFDNVILGDTEFKEVIEFNVKLTEKNLKNRTTYEDEVIKYLVREGIFWSVYVGNKHLQPYIDKFESLAESAVFPTALEYWSDMQIKTDSITGLPNKTGFLDKVKIEISRSKRYGNIMSVVFLKQEINNKAFSLSNKDHIDTVHRIFAANIKNKLRETDILGIWGRGEFVILMTETDRASAVIATNKLCNIEYHKDICEKYRTCIHGGVTQFDNSSLLKIIRQSRIKAIHALKICSKVVIEKSIQKSSSTKTYKFKNVKYKNIDIRYFNNY